MAKESKAKSKAPPQRRGYGPWIWSILTVIFAIYVGYQYTSSSFEPKEYTLPALPELTGQLAPDNRLRGAQLLLHDNVNGPESLLIEGDTIYTGTMDGRILKIVNGIVEKEIKFTQNEICGTYDTEPSCGRPLGIRRLDDKQLVVADAYLGIFVLDFSAGSFKNVLSPTDARFHDVPPKFFNDLDVVDATTILFSDSSSRWDRRRFLYPLLEQHGDGRLFKFNLRSGTLEALLTGLNFPNGVQIHPDRSSVLVSECGRSRVIRYHFTGPKNGHMERFVDNLPGFPDNLRLSADGTTLYIALAGVRYSGKPSLLDHLAGYPVVRKLIVDVFPAKWMAQVFQLVKPAYGLFVVVDANSGEVIDSLHDSSGVINDISQVSDDGRFYYLGSFHANFIGKIPKNNFKTKSS